MKLPIRISQENREPIYHQIETQFKSLIVSGQLKPNDPLPSIRELSSQLSCSAITTRKAYQNLESTGFIKTVQGKGTFVKEIETTSKEHAKTKVIQDVFLRAIEQAAQVGYSKEEMKTIFLDILSNSYGSNR